MRGLSRVVGRGFAVAMAAVLAALIYGVVWGEPAAHGAAVPAWQWFWQSYGGFLRRGLLYGGAAGLIAVWLLPRILSGSPGRARSGR